MELPMDTDPQRGRVCYASWEHPDPPEYMIDFQPSGNIHISRLACYSYEELRTILLRPLWIGDEQYYKIKTPFDEEAYIRGDPNYMIDEQEGVVDQIVSGKLRHRIIDAVYIGMQDPVEVAPQGQLLLRLPVYVLRAEAEFPLEPSRELFTPSTTVTCGSIIQRLFQLKLCPERVDIFTMVDSTWNRIANSVGEFDVTEGLPETYTALLPRMSINIKDAKLIGKELVEYRIREGESGLYVAPLWVYGLTPEGIHANFVFFKSSTREIFIYEPHGQPHSTVSLFIQIWLEEFGLMEEWALKTEGSCYVGLQARFKERGKGLCQIWASMIAFLWVRCPELTLREIEDEVASYGRFHAERLLNSYACYASGLYKGEK